MNKEHLLPIKESRLGVIGGSGFYSIDKIECHEEIEIDTPYGKPSDSIRLFKIGNLEIAFIARHGRTHRFNPTEVPYKANIWALRSIGVRWIIAPSAVGSLQEQIRPLDIVIPDQFIDRTHKRPATFFNEGAVAHVTMGDPFCRNLSGILSNVGEKNIPGGRQLHKGIKSSLFESNKEIFDQIISEKRNNRIISFSKKNKVNSESFKERISLLLDPQTCGPLLISCDPKYENFLKNEWYKVGEVIN